MVHAAVGSVAKSIGFIAGDEPLASEVIGLMNAVAKPLGVSVVPVLYPPSTTDFAPVAAQAIAAKAGAIFVAPGAAQVQPLFKALGQQGLASQTVLMTSAALFTPASVSALGSSVNGLYVLSPEALPVDPGEADSNGQTFGLRGRRNRRTTGSIIKVLTGDHHQEDSVQLRPARFTSRKTASYLYLFALRTRRVLR